MLALVSSRPRTVMSVFIVDVKLRGAFFTGLHHEVEL
jgi:hypothetical protein